MASRRTQDAQSHTMPPSTPGKPTSPAPLPTHTSRPPQPSLVMVGNAVVHDLLLGAGHHWLCVLPVLKVAQLTQVLQRQQVCTHTYEMGRARWVMLSARGARVNAGESHCRAHIGPPLYTCATTSCTPLALKS